MTSPSHAVRILDAQHLWHPYTQHLDAPAPVEIARAAGAWLYEPSGRPILDAISSWWVVLHGHGEPSIARAIAEQASQLDQVIFAGCTHEPAARLAAELASILPEPLSRVFLSDDGSTAVEVALKIALQLWDNRGTPRRVLVALDGAYHGDTFGAMSVSGCGVFTDPFTPHLFEVARLPSPDDPGLLAAFDRLLETRRGEVAALIVEPMVLGAGGMRTWSAQVLSGLADRAQDAGVLVIADEVFTGFGRTGPLFACEHAGIVPDMVCLSKGLTGGFLPLGATVVREELYDAFLSTDRRHTFFHGHSYTGNPIACAAARASLALLDADCTARRAGIATAQSAQLARVAGHARVHRPRVLGTLAAFDLDGTGYLDPIGRELAAFALTEGVLLRPLGSTVYVLPPYCTTGDELGLAWDVVYRFLERV